MKNVKIIWERRRLSSHLATSKKVGKLKKQTSTEEIEILTFLFRCAVEIFSGKMWKVKQKKTMLASRGKESFFHFWCYICWKRGKRNFLGVYNPNSPPTTSTRYWCTLIPHQILMENLRQATREAKFSPFGNSKCTCYKDWRFQNWLMRKWLLTLFLNVVNW